MENSLTQISISDDLDLCPSGIAIDTLGEKDATPVPCACYTRVETCFRHVSTRAHPAVSRDRSHLPPHFAGNLHEDSIPSGGIHVAVEKRLERGENNRAPMNIRSRCHDAGRSVASRICLLMMPAFGQLAPVSTNSGIAFSAQLTAKAAEANGFERFMETCTLLTASFQQVDQDAWAQAPVDGHTLTISRFTNATTSCGERMPGRFHQTQESRNHREFPQYGIEQVS